MRGTKAQRHEGTKAKKEKLMGTIRTHRDLIAWQKGMTLSKAIYTATQRMPEEERFGLTNQMRRAAVSVPSNIAEGYALETRMSYLRYLRISRGSLAELSTQWELTIQLNMLSPDPMIQSLLEETDRVLQGLIRGVQNSKPRHPPQ
jgi:four helix bundle protein